MLEFKNQQYITMYCKNTLDNITLYGNLSVSVSNEGIALGTFSNEHIKIKFLPCKWEILRKKITGGEISCNQYEQLIQSLLLNDEVITIDLNK